jgi:hypothetical protein
MNHIQLGIGAIALSIAFYGGMKLEQSKQMKLELVAQKAAENASIAAAKAISEIEIKQTTINNKVRESIKTELVYTECKHTPEAYSNILEKFK